MKHKVKHIHFVGIGGSGMSGIAEVLLNLGYRISVTARSTAGATSSAGELTPLFMSVTGAPGTLEPTFERVWYPYYNTSIIDVNTSGAGQTTLDIPGYVSVPMGRITINNAAGDPIRIEDEARTWEAVAVRLQEVGNRHVSGLVAVHDWRGAAADAYRESAQAVAFALDRTSDRAD